MRILLLLLPVMSLMACGGSNLTEDQPNQIAENSIEFFGNTQGTTYSVIVNDKIKLENHELEEVLHQFDLALSGYIPNSIVTKLNEAPAGAFEYIDSFGYFNRCYKLSQTVFDSTGGLFDPSVYPLVDGWGFLRDIDKVPDSSAVDSLKRLVSFVNGYHFNFISGNIIASDSLIKSKIIKNTPNAKLDFNAIAQGLAVDVLAELIEAKGAKNYFVEIGGEIRVKGKNSEGNFWRIGIDKPVENSNSEDRVIYEIIQVDNKSVATSGSYRKFYEKDGVKYSHTLNPKTGYPVQHSLLSATVVANDCATADAYATALMVMGPEKGIAFVNSHPELQLEAYLIFNNAKNRLETYYTEGFKALIYVE